MIARDRDREGPVVGLAEDGQRDLRARIATHLLDGVIQRHAAYRLVVDARDQVARTNAGMKRRRIFNRRNHLDQAIFRRNLDTKAREATLGLLLKLFVIGFVEV